MDQGKPPAPQERYWFKRDRYGWGWIPVKWQGFAWILLFFIVVAGVPVLAIQLFNVSTNTAMLLLVTTGIAMSLATNRVAPMKRWRWGRSPEDNPEEDF